MPPHCVQQTPCAYVPQFGRIVGRAGRQELAIPAEGNWKGRGVMSAELILELTGQNIPDMNGPVFASSSEGRPIRGKTTEELAYPPGSSSLRSGSEE